MPAYTIAQATYEHAVELAPNLRDADVAGVWAEQGLGRLESLCATIYRSRDPIAGLADGKVMCMFGVEAESPLSREGWVWMAAHVDLPKHSRAFLRASRKYIGHLRQNYDTIRVVVADENSISIRWHEWLGFEFYEPTLCGPAKVPAHFGRLR